MRRNRLICTWAVATMVASAAAQTVIVPAAANGVDASSSTSYPFDAATIHVQYIYDSSHFTAQGIAAPIQISRIRLRANQPTSAVNWAGGSSQLQLDLSTAPIDHLVIGGTFAANHGADRTTVFNGPLTTPPGSAPVGVPGPFHVDIPFTTPFVYDPNLGDLTLDFVSSGVNIIAMPSLDAEATTGVARARRTYNVTSLTAPTGTIWPGEIANVLELSYGPPNRLIAQFTADVTRGASPLTVHFTDQSFSSAPGGVTSWAWDFDGDAVVDSTVPNPTFTYVACGTFPVRLTVGDGVHAPNPLTKANYIATDEVTAAFTMRFLLAPDIFQLVDASTPPATAWAWDFDGDGIADSTQQHPILALPVCSVTTIALTATRNCRSNTVALPQLAAPLRLATVFAGNNSGASGWINLSDVSVTNPVGIHVCGIAHNTGTAAIGTPFTFDVYVAPDTYVGKDNDLSQWRLAASGTGVAAGADVSSVGVLAAPLYLPRGNHGLAIQVSGVGVHYSGAGGGGTRAVFSNSDLAITTGAVRTTLFNNGSLFSVREWNGALLYDTPQAGGSAGMGFFGSGCAGSLPISRQTVNSAPVLGSTLSITWDRLPFDFAAAVIGFSNTLLQGVIPLPVDLGVLGAPGCTGRVSDDLVQLLFGANQRATFAIGVPSTPTLAGVPFFTQAAVADTVNAFGFVFSDAFGGVLGF